MKFTYENAGTNTFLTAATEKNSGLTDFRLHILTNFELPHICHATVSSDEDVRKVRFDVTGHLVLADMFKEKRFTLPGLAVLIIAAIGAKEACKECMLEPEGICYKADKIFIETKHYVPHFIYDAETQEPDSVRSLCAFVCELAEKEDRFAVIDADTAYQTTLMEIDRAFLAELRALCGSETAAVQALDDLCFGYLEKRVATGGKNRVLISTASEDEPEKEEPSVSFWKQLFSRTRKR